VKRGKLFGRSYVEDKSAPPLFFDQFCCR